MSHVSVIVSAYNAGRTVAAALRSVFSQTSQDLEVIVVDDGSTDDTSKQIAEWGRLVTCITQPNSGPGSARNAGLLRATGSYVAFLDADNVWLPRKVERQLAYFAKHPETGLVHTATLLSRSPGAAVLETGDTVPMDELGAGPANAFCDLFHSTIHISTPTVMARREVLDAVGGFDERRDLLEDWDMWLRIAARYPVGYLAMPLAVHRPRVRMSTPVEVTHRGQELVIEQSAARCAQGCVRRRGASGSCIRERLHQLYSRLRYERLQTGQRRDARAAFRRALELNPITTRARLYHAAISLGRGWFDGVRRARRAVRSSPAVHAATAHNLVHDTVCRRARAAAVRVIHRLDDGVSALGRSTCRVLFEATSPMSLAVAGPVLDILRADARIELWFTIADGAWDPASMFRRAGIVERVVPASTARRMKVDAYINTDFWNMTWLPRRSRRIHLFHGVAGKYGLDAPTRIAPVVATFDRLMFPNRDRLRRYAEAGLVDPDGPAAALVGYPKVDCLVNGTLDRAAIERSLGLDRSAPTVLYAPTWSPHSSLNTSGESIIRALARMDVNVVVKLHDRSYDPADRASGGIDWRVRIERLCAELGVHLAQEFDASPYLFIADALVTDHSSVGFEYMLLDRPVVVVDCPELLVNARISQHKVSLLRSGADVVGADGAAHGVRLALENPGRLSERRQAIADELFYCPGRAAWRAAESIYDVLALQQPAGIDSRAAVAAAAHVSGFETRTTGVV